MLRWVLEHLRRCFGTDERVGAAVCHINVPVMRGWLVLLARLWMSLT